MEIPKDPTIRDVMLLVQQGFASVHAEMNDRFDGVNKQFISVNDRFDGVNKQFISVNDRFDDVNERLDAVEEQCSVTQEVVQGLAAHMDERFDALMPAVASKDFVERKVEAQSTKTHVLVNILKGKSVLTPQEAVDVMRT